MKFGQLIEYNMRNIFFEKSCTKCGGKSPDPFKKIKIEYCPHSLSLLYIKVEEYQNILKLRW